ncbi:DNA mismatch endonuclease (patch repair protein) [Kineococcus xinjiangensis]|uniref:DNA mismatch endonuclease (Patch repair protein) n=1 Tax=Kineococcus xinjiangensis TaxID=512762 RepID=A0A2S6IHQ2_9ACTN|nr:DNA mismatch endonuclease (patch repair protein) [Kineococcus xinjiangensis]
MRRTRRRDTAPELAVRRELHRRGRRFLVDVSPPGTDRRRRADLLLRGARVAVFVDGCFWHSCPLHLHHPKANAAWWRVKLASVVARDRDTDARLRAAGWFPLRVWEHEDPRTAVDRIVATQRLLTVTSSRRRRPVDGRRTM